MSDPRKIRVVHNAVRIPEQPLYAPDARKLLFLGAVSRRKGIYDLLDAMKQISPQLDPQWKLELYGPDVTGSISEEIAARGLENRVRYCGWLTPEQRPQVLAQTAVNLLPSYNEGLPMTIMEAMAAGIPSITTRVAAIPEAVTDKNGVLLEPGDVQALGRSILKLCSDAGLRQQMSRSSYETAAEKFSLDGHLCTMETLYKELLEE